jgi:hypothetical protein
MRITPSPRILSMLGEIEIAEWQCLAELIDNSVDEIQRRNEDEPPPADKLHALSCIEILLPRERTSTLENAEVVVRDHGRGMTRDQLQHAVKAGWTGNDPFERLGLFGMGFNISTARLGRVTEILTTRAGESVWRGVRIDLDEIGEDFEVPEIHEAKDDPAEHGTKVTVKRLDPARLHFLSNRHEPIRRKLGHVYSWLLEHTPVSILVNGKIVNPKRHCVWGEERSISYGKGKTFEQIPALIRIDHELPDSEACENCGHWQRLGLGECQRCGRGELRYRKRRIHGWVGVQRFLHTSQFGIDFIRNGRKILMDDKSVFEWRDPSGVIDDVRLEYPVEIPAGYGRIVGEIHLDHVPVDYKKDRFDTSSRDWVSAMTLIRGEAPIRPETAKRFGYEGRNDAPIARLVRGYQRNAPGARYLVPGDGVNATHDEARRWGTLFARGDADYQADTKWWEAVLFHEAEAERRNQPATTSGSVDNDAVLMALGVTPTPIVPEDNHNETSDSPDIERSEQQKPPTRDEYATSLRNGASPISYLSREYRINMLNGNITIKAWSVKPGSITAKDNTGPSPIWMYGTGGGRAELFIDQHHPVFTRSGAEELDMVCAEVAQRIGIMSGVHESFQLGELTAHLRADTFSDSNTDFTTVQEAARSLVNDIRERVMESVSENPKRAWSVLSSADIGRIEESFSSTNRIPESSDPSFIEAAPALYLVRLFEEWSEAFTDGRVFIDRYADLSADESKQMIRARLSSLLLDCAYMAVHEKEITIPTSLKRARLSIEILRQKLV